MTIPDLSELLNTVAGNDPLTFTCRCVLGEERTYTTTNYTVYGNAAWANCPTHDALGRTQEDAEFDERYPQQHIAFLDGYGEGTGEANHGNQD